jgi:hypothetical protein
VFKGLRIDLIRTLLEGRIPMPGFVDLELYGESHPGANYVGNLGESLVVSRLWDKTGDNAVIAFNSQVFNRMQREGNADVGKMEAAEFSYPYVQKPIPLEQIEFIFVSSENKEWLDGVSSGKITKDVPTGLREKLIEYQRTGIYQKITPIDARDSDTISSRVKGIIASKGYKEASLITKG